MLLFCQRQRCDFPSRNRIFIQIYNNNEDLTMIVLTEIFFLCYRISIQIYNNIEDLIMIVLIEIFFHVSGRITVRKIV